MAVHIGSRGTDSVLAMVVLVVVGTAVWANVGDADTAPIAFLFAILFAAPMLVRRRWPAGTLLLTAACLVVYYALGLPPIGLAVPVAVALWSAAEQGRIYWAIGTAVTLLVLSTIVRSVQGDDLGFVVGLELPASACLMAAVVAWGDGVRARRGWQEEIATVRRMAAQQRDREVVHQIERERLHFARELHDLLGHTLTVVSLHTAAAREALHDDPARAERSLCQAGTACREATDELRATVSALREPAATVPTPSLDRVDDVLAAARAAGLDVTLRADVVAPTLPSKVSNAAYRVVQESVSNVVTHSDARSVFVELRCADDELVVMVSDDGRGRTDDADRAGWGITGMRERVSLLGGRLHAGNRAEGGFAVEAHLPLRQHA